MQTGVVWVRRTEPKCPASGLWLKGVHVRRGIKGVGSGRGRRQGKGCQDMPCLPPAVHRRFTSA